MAKYNAKSVYGVLFTTLNDLSENNQEYLFKNIFTDKFLQDVKDNPKSAYSTLNDIVIDIENNNMNKTAELLKAYKNKLYMMKSMLKDYGKF